MRVLFLQGQPCIRTLKYAVGLRTARPDLVLGFAFQGKTLSDWYGTGDELFDHWWHLGPKPAAELLQVLAQFAPDLIHSHNLPDALTVLALDLVDGRIPVIHDNHDFQSLRRTAYDDGLPEPSQPLALERRAVEGCAALVVVSEAMLEEVAARYTPPARTVVFHNYALRRDLPAVLPPPDRPLRQPPWVVYQGTLLVDGGHYDLREHFTKMVAEGVRVDVYPGRPVPDYHALAASWPGLRCHESLDPRRLLQVLPGYDFGWAGFNTSLNSPHLDTVLPNKVYEYLGCGLPILTLGHRAMVRFVEQEGVGLSLATLDDLAGQLAAVDLPAMRRRVAEARQRLTVEANIGRIVELYETLAG